MEGLGSAATEDDLAAEQARKATEKAALRFTLNAASTLAGMALEEWETAYKLAAERARKDEQRNEELRDRIQELEERLEFWKREVRSNQVRSRSPHR